MANRRSTEGYPTDRSVGEFSLYDVGWHHLYIGQVIEDKPDAVWTEDPGLSRVEEIRFTDLMKGSRQRSGFIPTESFEIQQLGSAPSLTCGPKTNIRNDEKVLGRAKERF